MNEIIERNGYLYYKRKGLFVHRVLSEKYDGKIKEGWEVHHIDHDKKNNRANNLIQIPKGLHKEIHDAFSKWDGVTKNQILAKHLPLYLKRESDIRDIECKQRALNVRKTIHSLRAQLIKLDPKLKEIVKKDILEILRKY